MLRNIFSCFAFLIISKCIVYTEVHSNLSQSWKNNICSECPTTRVQSQISIIQRYDFVTQKLLLGKTEGRILHGSGEIKACFTDHIYFYA